jgi:hypothetical protein
MINFINPDNFKKWMKLQNDEFSHKLENTVIGSTAETKLSLKRIAKNITIEYGKANKIAKEFIENGGTVKEIIGEEYLIEVKSGAFFVNKRYVIV